MANSERNERGLAKLRELAEEVGPLPRSMFAIGNVRLALPTRIDEHLTELSTLADGWLDGEGLSVQPLSISRARDVLGWVHDQWPEEAFLNECYLYPTPNGGVQAEWTYDLGCVDLCFEPTGCVNIDMTEIDEFGVPAEHNPSVTFTPDENEQDIADQLVGRFFDRVIKWT